MQIKELIKKKEEKKELYDIILFFLHSSTFILGSIILSWNPQLAIGLLLVAIYVMLQRKIK